MLRKELGRDPDDVLAVRNTVCVLLDTFDVYSPSLYLCRRFFVSAEEPAVLLRLELWLKDDVNIGILLGTIESLSLTL